MAKSKHATALFEVMARQRAMSSRGGTVVTVLPPDKNGAPAAPSSSSSPKWWFKSKTSAEVKAAAPVDGAPATTVESSEWAPRAEAVIPPAAAVSAPAPMTESLADPTQPHAPRVQPVAMEVDPDRQQISLRLSYTSALIGGFGLVIALGLAILIGKSLSRGPAPALANTSTAQLRKAPATPGVMHLQRRSSASKDASYDVTDVSGGGAKTAGAVSTGTKPQAPQQSFNEPRPPATFFTDDPHRINGLNYAIIQSYPSKEKEMADSAAAFLTANGIPCTVEKELPGWRTTWKDGFILVGIRGFDKTKNNAALETYKKQIMQVSSKFTNGRNGFKSFEPTMYQWRKSS